MKCLIALDMFVCTIIWRDADVTISSLCGLELRTRMPAWWAKIIGQWLNRINPGHCEQAIVDDLARAKTAITVLEGEP